MSIEKFSPPRAANTLSRILTTFSEAHGTPRFPVNVKELALGCGEIFGWEDKITEVQAASIPGFEGCLFANNKKWLLLYNDTVLPGRVRFTQAHELGHFILHRMLQDSFQCSNEDMRNLSEDERDIEAQADRFSSYLLMPIDDYREQINTQVDIELLSHCADRYGVSLTASVLKWIDFTDEKAAIVMSKDGFIDWAWSSKAAKKSGAYFMTRGNVIPIPDRSLAADTSITNERKGVKVPASIWFKHADKDMHLREMKVYSDQFDSVLTLLYLPQSADVWPHDMAE